MTEHLHLCQTPAVAQRLTGLGYAARAWDTAVGSELYRGRSLVLVGAKGCPRAALDVALIAELAADAGAEAVRVLDYPDAPYVGPGFDLSRERLPHDLLARRIVDAAADAEPLRTRVPDILDLNIADQFAGPAPEQRWLVGAPEGPGGLLPDAAPILLAGRGGIGKTHAAVELAFLVGTWDGAAPAPRWWWQPIRKHGPSVVITYEEHPNQLHRKTHKLCAHHGVDLERGREGVMMLSMLDPRLSGEPLIAPDPRTRALRPTAEYVRLTKQLRRLRARRGELGVIVVDHAIRAFPVESNSVTDANAAIALMGRWATEFSCPVIVLAHTKKIVIEGGMEDEAILQVVMGSTGWVASVRATMVMWQLEAEAEARQAEALGDREFRPGVTRRRYVQAQVLKHNVDDTYEGRLTLRRNGGGCDDVTGGVRRAEAVRHHAEATAFARAVAARWDAGAPVQKSGSHGVFEQRERLGEPWAGLSKKRLRALVEACERAGLLAGVAEHPAHPRAKQARWLRAPGVAEADATASARAA